MSIKNILFIDTSSSLGGSINSLRAMVNSLGTKKNITLAIFTQTDTSAQLIAEGYKVIYINDWYYSTGARYRKIIVRIIVKCLSIVNSNLIYYFEILLHYSSLKKLASICYVRQINIIHANNKISRDIFMLWLKKLNLPIISHNRSHGFSNFGQLKRHKANKHIFRFIAVSRSIKYDMINNGIDKKKISVLWNIPLEQSYNKNINIRKKYNINKTKNYIIGAVGRLYDVKGYDFLLECLLNVKRKLPNIVLLLFGDGPLENHLLDKLKLLKLENNIIIAGNTNKPLEVIAQFDLLVLSSKHEGIPRVILEAMYVHTPIVCTRVGGIPEIIDHGVNGLMAEYGHIEEYSKCIIEMLTNKKLRQTCIENSRLFLKENLSGEKYATRIHEVYND
jgi:L-malate glycosyltransferase